MNANAEYLERLKRSGHQKSKQFENCVWGTVSSTVLFAAMIFVTDVWSRVAIAALLVGCMCYFFIAASASSSEPSSPQMPNREAVRQPTVTVVNATAASSVQNVARLLSPNKSKQSSRLAHEQQSSDWNENFDPQSPQRIAQAVVLEKQNELNSIKAVGPTGTGLLAAPSLYPNANMSYPSKAGIGNLSYQFSGSSYGSPAGSSVSAFNRSAAGMYPTSQYQQEPAAPVWHAYHSSPPNDIPSSSGYGRSPGKYRSTAGQAGGAAEEEDRDPLREIVGRVAAEMRGTEPVSMTSPMFNRNSADSTRMSPFRTPGGASSRGFLSSRKGALFGAGLTEDRLEHVLGKYLESQEEIVQETSNEILRQLAERASRGALPLVQTQEDLNRIKALLQLQADRQVLQNRSSVGLAEIINYCRSTGISEELLRRYEAAVAVLQSPNHNYSNRGTPAGPSASRGGGGISSSSGSSGLAGSGLLSASKGWGTPGAGYSYGGSVLDQPVDNSSGAFNSTRRTRRR